MRKQGKALFLAVAAVLVSSSLALAQTAPAQAKPGTAKGGPAPRRDITGVWIHTEGAGSPVNKPPQMTPEGQKIFSTRRTDGGGLVADSNDPMVKCDPLGFPRNIVWEIRGIQFVPAAKKMVELFQYQKVWREIWMDGRSLPKNAGSDLPNAPDPRYYGYSIGHWDGDNTFVVESNDTDATTWLDNAGHPHSNELQVEEDYRRADHDNLEITVKVDDPKIYTKPWTLSTVTYVWNPKQEFEEQLCIPSDMQRYMDLIANPAGEKKK